MMYDENFEHLEDYPDYDMEDWYELEIEDENNERQTTTTTDGRSDSPSGDQVKQSE